PHLALALEEGAVLDQEPGRDERSRDPRARQYLDPLPPVDPTAHRAPDGDDAAVDVGLHLSRLADDQGVVGDDLPLQPTIDAQGVAEAELAQELRPFVHETVEVLGYEALELDHRSLPVSSCAGALRGHARGTGGRPGQSSARNDSTPKVSG